MIGVSSDGKIILVNKDFSIRIPHGAAYDLDDGNNDYKTVLSITRFEELPQNYAVGSFQAQIDPRMADVITVGVSHEFEDDTFRQMDFQDFLGELKRSADEQFQWSAVGSVGTEEGSADNYRVLKVVQDSPEIKAGYITTDLFVAVKFVSFIFTPTHGYRGILKIERSPQKFKRTEFFMKSLLGSVKPNTI